MTGGSPGLDRGSCRVISFGNIMDSTQAFDFFVCPRFTRNKEAVVTDESSFFPLRSVCVCSKHTQNAHISLGIMTTLILHRLELHIESWYADQESGHWCQPNSLLAHHPTFILIRSWHVCTHPSISFLKIRNIRKYPHGEMKWINRAVVACVLMTDGVWLVAAHAAHRPEFSTPAASHRYHHHQHFHCSKNGVSSCRSAPTSLQ